MRTEQLRAIYLIDAGVIIGLSALVDYAAQGNATVIEALSCDITARTDGSIKLVWEHRRDGIGTMIYHGSYLGVI